MSYNLNENINQTYKEKKLSRSDSHWKKILFFLEKKNFPLVKKYSTNNGMRVIAITDNLISKSSKYYKKPQWQKLFGW